MSGSETYAQIQPPPQQPVTVAAEINPAPPPPPTFASVDSAPQPPSVDSLKHVTAHGHSRQASSSSSVGNLGSPKPEKRQANSPLPPPPPPPVEFPTCKTLDDMYAKVQKHKKKEGGADESDPVAQNLSADVRDDVVLVGAEPEVDAREHNYETLRKTRKERTVDTGYEQLRPRDTTELEPGYSSINGPTSRPHSDAGYEEVLLGNDPNYEELEGRTPSVGYATIPDPADGYALLNKTALSSQQQQPNGSNSPDEPNYESMPSSSISEPAYAPLKSGSDTDPNYESVKYLDEPPYERLENDDDEAKEPGYERVAAPVGNGGVACKSDYGYETIRRERGGGEANGESDEDSIVQV